MGWGGGVVLTCNNSHYQHVRSRRCSYVGERRTQSYHCDNFVGFFWSDVRQFLTIGIYVLMGKRDSLHVMFVADSSQMTSGRLS